MVGEVCLEVLCGVSGTGDYVKGERYCGVYWVELTFLIDAAALRRIGRIYLLWSYTWRDMVWQRCCYGIVVCGQAVGTALLIYRSRSDRGAVMAD